MAIRIPPNQIIYKYTAGNEYMFEINYRKYQGYYYEINGKVFAGEKFNPDAPVLILIPKSDFKKSINPLLMKASTYVYGKVSKVKIPDNNISSIPFNSVGVNKTIEYILLCSKINQTPIIIKPIDENTYASLQNNALYKTTFVGKYENKIKSIEEADKEIPGVKLFLSSNPSINENLFNLPSTSLPPQLSLEVNSFRTIEPSSADFKKPKGLL